MLRSAILCVKRSRGFMEAFINILIHMLCRNERFHYLLRSGNLMKHPPISHTMCCAFGNSLFYCTRIIPRGDEIMAGNCRSETGLTVEPQSQCIHQWGRRPSIKLFFGRQTVTLIVLLSCQSVCGVADRAPHSHLGQKMISHVSARVRTYLWSP